MPTPEVASSGLFHEKKSVRSLAMVCNFVCWYSSMNAIVFCGQVTADDRCLSTCSGLFCQCQLRPVQCTPDGCEIFCRRKLTLLLLETRTQRPPRGGAPTLWASTVGIADIFFV